MVAELRYNARRNAASPQVEIVNGVGYFNIKSGRIEQSRLLPIRVVTSIRS